MASAADTADTATTATTATTAATVGDGAGGGAGAVETAKTTKKTKKTKKTKTGDAAVEIVKLQGTYTWKQLEKWDNTGGAESVYKKKVTVVTSINTQQVRDSVMSKLQKTSHEASVAAEVKYAGVAVSGSVSTSYKYGNAHEMYNKASYGSTEGQSKVTTIVVKREIKIPAGKTSSLWQRFYDGPGFSGGLDEFQTLAGDGEPDDKKPIEVDVEFEVTCAIPMTLKEALKADTLYLQSAMDQSLVWLDTTTASSPLTAGGRLHGGVDIHHPDDRAVWELTPAAYPEGHFEYSFSNGKTASLLAASWEPDPGDGPILVGGMNSGQGNRERWSIKPGKGKYKDYYKLELVNRGTLINDGNAEVTKMVIDPSPDGLHCYWRFIKPLPRAVDGATAASATGDE